MDEKLLTLPWQIQVSIGSGYAAYLIAYVGIRQHHTTADAAFKAAAFGIVTIIVLLQTAAWSPSLSIIAAFGWTIISGAVWRRFGIAALKKALRESDTSWADDVPSAWQTLTVCNSKYPVSQITVELQDGTLLQCADTRPFADEPHGPMTIGANGDVALYVTDIVKQGVAKEVTDVKVDYWGSEITYVPASSVKSVSIRHYTGTTLS